MALFSLRYDLRCPPFAGVSAAELAATALEQCEWADRLGFVSVTLSEHHGSDDGYLPSPLVLGAAIAARTVNLRLILGALIAPLHDPVRLAEDLAVLDIVSNGRIIPVLSGGYVAGEFRAFGRTRSERKRVMDEIVPFLEKAWSGEPFEHHGRPVRVTPRPVQQPRPPIWLGGSSVAAARRAARFADGFLPSLPEYHEAYRAESIVLGKPDPGPAFVLLGNFVHVARDPDAAWRRIAPHALHETNAYARWAADTGADVPYRPIDDPDALRASGQYPVVTPEQLVEQARTLGPMGTVMLHPLMGGMAPALSWESLRLIESDVLPALTPPPGGSRSRRRGRS
jgi:alkanesulfonate monooxygenase SsuD/methylene tetrahydromethanopterin reductase-like flavin-dependent oxidoreductase (luciferase family)